jgi:hypothetical protein
MKQRFPISRQLDSLNIVKRFFSHDNITVTKKVNSAMCLKLIEP